MLKTIADIADEEAKRLLKLPSTEPFVDLANQILGLRELINELPPGPELTLSQRERFVRAYCSIRLRWTVLSDEFGRRFGELHDAAIANGTPVIEHGGMVHGSAAEALVTAIGVLLRLFELGVNVEDIGRRLGPTTQFEFEQLVGSSEQLLKLAKLAEIAEIERRSYMAHERDRKRRQGAEAANGKTLEKLIEAIEKNGRKKTTRQTTAGEKRSDPNQGLTAKQQATFLKLAQNCLEDAATEFPTVEDPKRLYETLRRRERRKNGGT